MSEQITNIDWEFLFDSIAEEKTVLFIGPSIAINPNGKSAQNDFFENFFLENSKDIVSYHKQDGFLLFRDEGTKMRLTSRIKKFYQQNFAKEIITKISQIPFHLVILVSPDLTIKNVFTESKFQFEYNYFDNRKLRDIENTPTKQNPLIYSLFGSVEDTETLIISHQDLFDYLRALYGSSNLPIKLRTLISKEKASNFIFIGLDFDKWYFQLLMNLLELNNDRFIRYASLCELDIDNKTLCENHFKINFIAKNTVSFVDSIYDYFEKRNELRKPVKEDEKPKKYLVANIQRFISEGFDDDTLNVLCLGNFYEVYNQFAANMSKPMKVGLLINYVVKRNQLADLLKYSQELNPVGYENFKPYWE